MSSVSYVVSLLSPSIAAVAMTWIIWLPFCIGIGCLLIAMATAMSLPKQQVYQEPEPARSEDDIAETGVDVEPLLRQNSLELDHSRPLKSNSLRSKITSDFQSVYEALSKPNFRMLLLVFFLASMASSNTPLFPQYISKRFGWTFAQAGYLLSVKALVNIFLLAIAVPGTIRILARTGMDGTSVSLFGASKSFMFSIFGALIVALSFETWQLFICESCQLTRL
jgi:hypothetical protein